MDIQNLSKTVLMLFAVLYVSVAVQPNTFLTDIFSLWYIRLIALILLAYTAMKDMKMALILAVVFLVTVNYIRTGNISLEGFDQPDNYKEDNSLNAYGYKRCLLNSDCQPGAGCDGSGFCLPGIQGTDLIPTDTRKPYRPSH